VGWHTVQTIKKTKRDAGAATCAALENSVTHAGRAAQSICGWRIFPIRVYERIMEFSITRMLCSCVTLLAF
jgi:hypothetical protein